MSNHLLRTNHPRKPFSHSLIPKSRTKSASMAYQPPPGLPYRDVNNQTVAYATAPNADPLNPIQDPLYDSDFEPLITGPPGSEALDEDAMTRFTATGRPMPGFKHSALVAMGGDMFSLPQLLPRRYTDDSIIPAIVVGVIPSAKTIEEEERKKGRRGSFLKKLKGEPQEKDTGKGLTKVVYMPRRDYLKWFARDPEGKYIGTEPYKKWEEEELEEAFKQYKPAVQSKRSSLSPYAKGP